VLAATYIQWELTRSVVALLVLTTIREPRWAIAYLLLFGWAQSQAWW